MYSMLDGVSPRELEDAAERVNRKPTEEIIKPFGPNEVTFLRT